MNKQDLKSKIEKLEKGIASKVTPENLKASLKSQKEKFEKELSDLEKKEKSDLSKKIKDLKSSVGSKNTKSSLSRDGARKAKKSGKRVAADGSIYYEKRANRTDSQTKKKPYLEKGGYMAEGGQVGEETIHLKSYNIHGQEINSGNVIVNYSDSTIKLPFGKTYKVENDREYAIKVLKTKIKASGGIKGLSEFLKEMNEKDSPFNPSLTNQFINGFDKYAEGGIMGKGGELEGMHAQIYRSDYDSPTNKLYGKKMVTIVDSEVPKIFEADSNAPAVRLVRRNIGFGKNEYNYIHAVPVGVDEHRAMMGGTFIYSSDSRFPNKFPIPLHDRVESYEDGGEIDMESKEWKQKMIKNHKETVKHYENLLARAEKIGQSDWDIEQLKKNISFHKNMLNEYKNEKMAKGGKITFYDKETSYKLGRPSSYIQKDVISKVTTDEEDFAGNFGWESSKGKLSEGYLYKLDKADKDFVSEVKLKDGEKIFRYITYTTAVGGMKPLIKINIDKGLLYFLVDSNKEEAKFETVGVKALWVNLITEKMAKGGDLYDDMDEDIEFANKKAKALSKSLMELGFDVIELTEADYDADANISLSDKVNVNVSLDGELSVVVDEGDGKFLFMDCGKSYAMVLQKLKALEDKGLLERITMKNIKLTLSDKDSYDYTYTQDGTKNSITFGFGKEPFQFEVKKISKPLERYKQFILDAFVIQGIKQHEYKGGFAEAIKHLDTKVVYEQDSMEKGGALSNEEYDKLNRDYNKFAALYEDAVGEEKKEYEKELERLSNEIHKAERGYEKGGYVAVSEKDGYWYIMSKPTTKESAQELIKLGVPRGEEGKVVTLEEAKAHKKVIGAEYLEKGGYMAKGGSIKNQYEGKTASEVWSKWTEQQRSHFLLDHSELLDKDRMENNLGYSRTIQKDKSFTELTPHTQRVLESHVNSGQYEKGGYMASGGILKGRNNETGESFGVVIGSVVKSDEYVEGGTEMNVRISYSNRMGENKLVFDSNGNLFGIMYYPYVIDGFPDTTYGAFHQYNADKKDTLNILAHDYNAAFAKKLIELAKGEVKYAGYMEKGGQTFKGLSVDTVVSDKIKPEEVGEFVKYVHNVYGEEGYTKEQVQDAVSKYLRDLQKQHTWGEGDSLDRERVYEYLKNPRLESIKNPTFADGGSVGQNIEVFGYTTENFDICPLATEEFEKAAEFISVSDSDTKKLALSRAAMYVDDVFGVEKRAQKDNLVSKNEFEYAVNQSLVASAYNYASGLEVNLSKFIPMHISNIASKLVQVSEHSHKDHVSAYDVLMVRDTVGEAAFKNMTPEERLNMAKQSKFEEGGSIEGGNAQMVMSQAKSIKHHAKELMATLTPETPIMAWVVAKMERAASDISDVAHYVDGLTPAHIDEELDYSFAKGGEVKYKDVDGIERTINFFVEGNKLMYFEPILDRNEIAAYINDSSKVVSPAGSYVLPNPIAKATIKWSRKNGYTFIQDDKEYAEGGELSNGVYYLGKPRKEGIVWAQKVVEIDNDGIYFATDYARKIKDFSATNKEKLSYEDFQKFLKEDARGKNISDKVDMWYHYASGGMITGRWYKDNSGKEFRYIGEDSTGNSLFSDGEKVSSKSLEDFETKTKESKLFGFFEEGGELKEEFLEDVEELHKEIAEITLVDGSKISHEELMAAHKMAKGGKVEGMYVVLSAVPNVDYEDIDYRGEVSIKPINKKVNSVEEAQQEVRKFIEKHELGGGNWPNGEVFKDGKKIGYISYNGRFWPNENKMGSGGFTSSFSGTPDRRRVTKEKGGYMAKGGGIYSSDSLYYLQVLKDGEEVGREKFRAKSLKEAREIAEDDYEKDYQAKFGDHLSFIVSEAMADGGEVGWKKAVTIKRPTKTEAQKNAKLLAEYYGNSGRNFKVEKRDDKYVVTYEFNLSDKMAKGGLTKEQTLEVAEKYAKALSKTENKKVSVNMRTLEEDSFDLDMDGIEYDGGSYNIYDNGDVKNMALSTKPIYGKKDSNVDEIVKNLSKMSKGGKVKFEDKVKAIKASLLKTKKVPKKVQKDYGKTYNAKEAEQAAKRIAGAMRKKEMK